MQEWNVWIEANGYFSVMATHLGEFPETGISYIDILT